jgi:hypothetical protein
VEAGDDVSDLLILCRADITSKNKIKVAKHIENLKKVEEKIQEVLEKDELRNWQPVLTGNHILERYEIADPRKIGDIKNHVREAILDGIIHNDLEQAFKIADEFAANMNIRIK